MALDLDALDDEAKGELIEDGRRFASERTLAQADWTLVGLKKYGEALKPFGFVERDAEMLKDVRDAIKAVLDARHGERRQKKGLTKDYYVTLAAGLRIREQARAVLINALRDLRFAGATEARNAVQVALEATSLTAEQPRALATQIQALLDVSTQEGVKASFTARSEEGFVDTLKAQIEGLDAVAGERIAVKPGTPELTQHLDLLDGLIASLARSARTSAESASKKLVDPLILNAFALDQLYGR